MANTVKGTANIQILSIEDSTGNVLVNRNSVPSLDQVFAGLTSYAMTPDTVQHDLVLPLNVPLVKHFYLRHLGTLGSILVSAIPNKVGAVVLPMVLVGPGDVCLYWQAGTGSAPVTGITQGYTGFKYQASTVGIPFEYYIGG